jgi:hypothetical protein
MPVDRRVDCFSISYKMDVLFGCPVESKERGSPWKTES